MQPVKVLVGVGMGVATAMYFATQYQNMVQKLLLLDINRFSPTTQENDMGGLIDGLVEGLLPEAWRQGHVAEVKHIKDVMNSTTIEGFVTTSSALSSSTSDLRPKMGSLASCVDEGRFVAEHTDYRGHEIIELLCAPAEAAFIEACPTKKLVKRFCPGYGPAMFLSDAETYAWFVREMVGGSSRRTRRTGIDWTNLVLIAELEAMAAHGTLESA